MQAQLTKQETIAEITGRLVEFFHPVSICLFGSEARGDADPDSDLDFLVVVPDDAPDEIFRPGALRRARLGIAHAAGLIPWRQSDFDALTVGRPNRQYVFKNGNASMYRVFFPHRDAANGPADGVVQFMK